MPLKDPIKRKEYRRKYSKLYGGYKNRSESARLAWRKRVAARTKRLYHTDALFREHRLNKRRQRQFEQRRALRLEAIRLLGGECICCGEKRWELLTVDHSKGGGSVERRVLTYIQLYQKYIREATSGRYRVLCYNCNCSRGSVGYCPHEREKQIADAAKYRRI